MGGSIDILPLQKLMSLLKAMKSKSRWTAETPKVTRMRTRMVSAKIPFTSSVSLSVSPNPAMDPRAEVNCKNSLSLPKEIGL